MSEVILTGRKIQIQNVSLKQSLQTAHLLAPLPTAWSLGQFCEKRHDYVLNSFYARPIDVLILLIRWKISVEPPHDKTNKVAVRPAETQISLGIRPESSESSRCAQWIAKDPRFLHADIEDSDQTGRMSRLI